jgi:hypothetical protein
MKPPKLFPSLKACFAAALLLLLGSSTTGVAQRRRRPATTPRPNVAAPNPNTTTTLNTPPKPNTTQTPPSPAPQTQTSRRPEPDLSFEEMLAADSYSVYAEVRRVGTLAQGEELKMAVGALDLFGAETKPLTDLFRFVSDNAETLAEARVVVTLMPARASLPQTLLAVELPSTEAAVAFEPKLRRMLGEQIREVKKAIEPEVVKQETGGQTRSPVKQKGEPKGEPKTGAPDFALRRVGRWLIAAESPFTLRALRGEEGEARFADSARFQSVRSRFSAETLFVYVDTNVAQQGWALQQQKASEAQSNVALTATTEDNPRVSVEVAEKGPTLSAPTTAQTQAPAPASTPEQSGEDAEAAQSEMEPAPDRSRLSEAEENLNKLPPPPKPTEEELALRGMGSVLENLWGGVPRIPGAVALGAGLERGALVLRLAVENTPDGTIALIPFLPNIVSGPPVTADAASVAPADSELFFAASLDWTQIYNSTLGAASVNPTKLSASWGEEPEAAGKGERPPTAEQSIAAVEKLFGFKFKEDLLPALGNEVAFSMPLDTGDFGFGARRRVEPEKEKKEEKDAEPGFIYIASLNNPDKMREILPRALFALGFTATSGAERPPEKRLGFEIHDAGALSYVIINNFLVLGELKAVRYCIDSYDKRQTLADSNAYRDATSWQAKQKLVHLFVSDTIMRNVIDETKKRSGESTDPVVRALLTQLETAQPEPASYEATNEGDLILHELRLPLSLVRSYAVAMTISVKDAPVITGESMAIYALSNIVHAEDAFKDGKKKERYGTLEELVAERLLEKNFDEHMEYRIELNAAGDKFEATATPKTYGKSGRRSFFVNEMATTRGADHKGQPANADDPPVD